MTFIFLPEDGASANDELARFHEEFLAAGNVGWVEREADFRWLMSHWLKPQPWKQGGTTCALYQGSAMQACGIQAQRHVNTAYAITTWMKVGEYIQPEWVPFADIESGKNPIIRGDILYWVGSRGMAPNVWRKLTTGHVGCVLTGDGFTWKTAEGGGGLPLGTCRMSDAPKDITKTKNGRALQGLWRPNHMRSVIRGRREPEDIHDTQPDGFVELRRGMRGPRVGEWQNHLLRLHFELPKYGADSDFGGETEAATRAFQIKNTIPNTGIVDRRTFETAKAM